MSAYERFNEAGDNVDKEATLLVSLYHDFKMYPEPFSNNIRQDVFKYAKVTIEQEKQNIQKREILVELTRINKRLKKRKKIHFRKINMKTMMIQEKFTVI